MSGTLAGRIGIIGDVHAEDDLLETALTSLSREGVERVLCVGDIADGPGSVDRACALLAEHRVATVRGNHDRWVLTDTMRDLPDAVPRAALAPKTLRYLHGLPPVLTFSSRWGRVLLCHGLGSNDMASVMPDDFGYALDSNTELQSLMTDRDTRIIINGHTHRPMLRSFGGLTIINAGTLYREHDPGYVIADFAAGSATWHALTRSETRVLGSLPPDLEGP